MKGWRFFLTLMVVSLVTVLTFTQLIPQLQASDRYSDHSYTDNYTDQMAQMHNDEVPVPTPVAQTPPAQDVVTEEVIYATVDGRSINGYYAKPEAATEPLPGIIAIHEWWGLNDNIRAVTERLAGEGYQVLAVDLYSGQTGTTRDEARQLMQGVMENTDPALDNLQQAYDYLTTQQQATKVGTIGWCFGGAWSLQSALILAGKVDATAIYYGQLVTDPDVLTTIQAPIAGFFGGQDQGIPLSSVKTCEETLNQLGKTAEIYIYPEADHAFANPSGNRYNAEAATDAWNRTIAFFQKYLR